MPTDSKAWIDAPAAETDLTLDRGTHGCNALTVVMAAALDHLVANSMTALMLPVMIASNRTQQRSVQEELILLKRYHEIFAAQCGAPEDNIPWFEQPRTPDAIIAQLGDTRWNGQMTRLKFRTQYSPLIPEMVSLHSMQRRNRWARARLWHHDDQPRPTLIVIHGFSMDSPKANSRILGLSNFFEAGFDILFVTLPHHGVRREKGVRLNGLGLYLDGMVGVNEAIMQAAHEIRVFVDWLETRGVTSISITGISLGGYMTALMAGIEPRLSAAIAVAPVVSLTDLMMCRPSTRRYVERQINNHKFTLGDFRRGMALHTPLSHEPRIPHDRLMIVSGAGDRFTPPGHVKLLHDHWDQCRLEWFAGNHMWHVGKSRLFQPMIELLQRSVKDR